MCQDFPEIIVVLMRNYFLPFDIHAWNVFIAKYASKVKFLKQAENVS